MSAFPLHQVKKLVDWTAVAGGTLSFFKAIPWPEIAGFLSAVWISLQIAHWIYKRLR